MARTFIVYYDFSGTSGNHAGMTHLVNILNKELLNITLIKSMPHHFKAGKYLAKGYALWLALYFKLTLKKGDKVFFFEYLTKGTAYQALTAELMRSLKVTNAIYALIHLSGQHLLELHPGKAYLQKSLMYVDKVFVLGSSLATFLRSIGFTKEIVTTFHYVDTNYYKPLNNKSFTNNLNVICIGKLKRNFGLLQNIVSRMPEVTFHILMGSNNLTELFKDMKNVKLYPFIPEEEMLHLMQSCDMSLSVLDDTIGSNVITTSMAVGLVQVVSDVGSIRDYCSDEDSFLCKREEDYMNAILKLEQDRELLQKMKTATLKKAQTISHKAFVDQFKKLV